MTAKPDHEAAAAWAKVIKQQERFHQSLHAINLARCYLERCKELAALKECVFGNHKWESAMTRDGDPIQRCTVCGDST